MQLAEAARAAQKNLAPHEPVPPDQWDPSPQGQALLTKRLNSGGGSMAAAGLTVVSAATAQWRRLDDGSSKAATVVKTTQ